MHGTCLLEDHFRYHEHVSAVARYCAEVPSPQRTDLASLATSPSHDVDVDGEADWDLAAFNAAEEPLAHTSLNAKCTERREVCRFADVSGNYL